MPPPGASEGDRRTLRTTLDLEAAHRRLEADLEADLEGGEFPTVRRSLRESYSKLAGIQDELARTAGKLEERDRWRELVARLKETVYLHEDDYYTETEMERRRDRLYNIEWCLRTLVPWQTCMYPNEAPGESPPRPKPAEPKGVYRRERAPAGRSLGYGRP